MIELDYTRAHHSLVVWYQRVHSQTTQIVEITTSTQDPPIQGRQSEAAAGIDPVSTQRITDKVDATYNSANAHERFPLGVLDGGQGLRQWQAGDQGKCACGMSEHR